MKLLPFEEQDASLVPMSARRALDLAGLKISLLDWQRLSWMVRETLAAIGEEPEVDAERVAALLDVVDTKAIDPIPDPPADVVPEDVRAALGERSIADAAWSTLSVVERYAIASYARRGRGDRLARAYDVLIAQR